MTERIIPSFIRLFKKPENAPDWVIGKMIMNIDEFAKFVKDGEHISEYQHKDGSKNRQVKIDILTSKEGVMYCAIDTYAKQ